MSSFTRRTIMQSGLALASSAAAPRIAFAQRGGGKTIRTVGDITSYDPVVSATYSSHYHATMVYDTLFAYDSQYVPRPQMVDKFAVSDDKLTWTFELRDGLKFHDGTLVSTADVIPSIRRWGARDGAGQVMMKYVKEISAKDAKTFTIQLKDHFGLVIDLLGKNCFIMRKKEAETDPAQKIDTVIGSGPFRLNLGETKPGTQYVYDKFADYVPRKEAPDGLAGGKVVKVDRVIYVNMPDAQTAVAAVQAGEIDFYGGPPLDLLDQLSHDRNVKLQVLYAGANVGIIRFNFLHAPFDSVKCRQAILNLVNQTDYLKAIIGNPKYYKICGSYFGCDVPMENDANTSWFKAAPNYDRAKQLLKEGGYDGRPVILLQQTSYPPAKIAAEILADQMRRAGIDVRMEPMDGAAMWARSASKAPPEQGGWHMFITSAASTDADSPLWICHRTNGEKGWLGWPTDARNEELTTEWALGETVEQRKKIAREIQENAWNFVPYVWYGQWVQPVLMHANLNGVLSTPFAWSAPWWNAEKA
ncbi:peptide/nickel transport system substrate-binding protein [Bradyrhizobium sp. i1.15.2]|uniref:ABC transporter substrate-binding protein n=1 Tax=Bradyrhizobium sp. i1.15.2 TaxID=3156362 RepID=UPI00339641C5